MPQIGTREHRPLGLQLEAWELEALQCPTPKSKTTWLATTTSVSMSTQVSEIPITTAQSLISLLSSEAQARIVNRAGIVGSNAVMDGVVQGSNSNLHGTSQIRVMGNVLPANLERK